MPPAPRESRVHRLVVVGRWPCQGKVDEPKRLGFEVLDLVVSSDDEAEGRKLTRTYRSVVERRVFEQSRKVHTVGYDVFQGIILSLQA